MAKKKVLIIDDEQDVAGLTAKLLENSGHEVDCHFDGQGAYEVIQETKPDVILLDIRLPNVSGIDIFNRIRGEDNLKSIPVIFFSVSATDREMCLVRLGAEGYVEKPFELETLLSEINRVTEGQSGT